MQAERAQVELYFLRWGTQSSKRITALITDKIETHLPCHCFDVKQYTLNCKSDYIYCVFCHLKIFFKILKINRAPFEAKSKHTHISHIILILCN